MVNINKTASLLGRLLQQRRNAAKILFVFLGAFSFCAFFASSMYFGGAESVSAAPLADIPAADPGQITLQLLDATGTSEIDLVKYGLTPNSAKSAATKRILADVSTTNATGYKLYMESNYQKDGNYTTNLVNSEDSIEDYIPTTTADTTLYWNYINPLQNTVAVIPAHDQPDKVG